MIMMMAVMLLLLLAAGSDCAQGGIILSIYIRVGGRYYQGFLRMVLVLTLRDSSGIGLPLELQKVSTEAG